MSRGQNKEQASNQPGPGLLYGRRSQRSQEPPAGIGHSQPVELEPGLTEWRRLSDGLRHREIGPALLLDSTARADLPCHHRDHEAPGCVEVHGPALLFYSSGLLGSLDRAAVDIDDGGLWRDYVWDVRIDGPAELWYVDDRPHREDGPAIISEDGEHWFQNGQRHRADGPATVWNSGTRVWYFEDQLSRADGPAIEYSDGRREWWLGDRLHRDDGPAVVLPEGEWSWYPDEVNYLAGAWEPCQYSTPDAWAIDGPSQIWMENGRFHREEGPAVEGPLGRREYWRDGEPIRADEWAPQSDT